MVSENAEAMQGTYLSHWMMMEFCLTKVPIGLLLVTLPITSVKTGGRREAGEHIIFLKFIPHLPGPYR